MNTDIKINRVTGDSDTYTLISAFELDGNSYAIVDSKAKDASGNTIVCISKVNGNELETIDYKTPEGDQEWREIKKNLIAIVKNTAEQKYITIETEVNSGDSIGQPLALKEANLNPIVEGYNNYKNSLLIEEQPKDVLVEEPAIEEIQETIVDEEVVEKPIEEEIIVPIEDNAIDVEQESIEPVIEMPQEINEENPIEEIVENEVVEEPSIESVEEQPIVNIDEEEISVQDIMNEPIPSFDETDGIVELPTEDIIPIEESGLEIVPENNEEEIVLDNQIAEDISNEPAIDIVDGPFEAPVVDEIVENGVNEEPINEETVNLVEMPFEISEPIIDTVPAIDIVDGGVELPVSDEIIEGQTEIVEEPTIDIAPIQIENIVEAPVIEEPTEEISIEEVSNFDVEENKQETIDKFIILEQKIDSMKEQLEENNRKIDQLLELVQQKTVENDKLEEENEALRAENVSLAEESKNALTNAEILTKKLIEQQQIISNSQPIENDDIIDIADYQNEKGIVRERINQ